MALVILELFKDVGSQADLRRSRDAGASGDFLSFVQRGKTLADLKKAIRFPGKVPPVQKTLPCKAN